MARLAWMEQRTLKELALLAFGGAAVAMVASVVLTFFPQPHRAAGFHSHFRVLLPLLMTWVLIGIAGALVWWIVSVMKRRVGELEWDDAQLASLKRAFLAADRLASVAFIAMYVALQLARYDHLVKPFTADSWAAAGCCLYLTQAGILHALKAPTRTMKDEPLKPVERWKPIVSESWGERNTSG